MCGIAGFLRPSPADAATLTDVAARMARTLSARGPDDEGVWADGETGVALGHRRLSIIDLSALGHQPMHSADGRYILTFNGEIYNFIELKQELEGLGHAFRGSSDTEVMLEAFSEWGVQRSVSRFNGMFAFGLWDRAEQMLHLVRDRIGEKPLYYGWLGRTFAFASELKALRVHPDFTNGIDREALALYLRYTYVPTPYSIYRGVFKLPPGCILSLPRSRAEGAGNFSKFPEPDGGGPLNPVRYWSASAAVARGGDDPCRGSEREAADQLDTLLRDSVSRRMIADVPLGTLLSGGVDSSTVAALMQRASSTPVRTFAIGFRERGFDEAAHAATVARHLGTDHTELYVGSQDALRVVDRLPTFYDEPFADASQIPTYVLCSLIRDHVTVALSGDGGDELFGGYNRYIVANSIWRKVGWLPRPLRGSIGRLLRIPSPDQWERVGRRLSFLAREYGTQGTFGDKFHKLADVMSMPDANALYHRLVSCWMNPEEIVRDGKEGRLPDLDVPASIRSDDLAARMMFFDLVTYLPDDILTKVDRASMATSLEVRVPLLDHRVVEFAWRLPTSMKINRDETKRVLRQVLYRYVPRELIERPKMGFGIPLAEWLRGPLRNWAEDLLDEKKLREDGLLNPAPIRALWAEHLSGRRNWQSQLWCVLMFQAWNRQAAP